jgi:hypothetical protein
MFVHLISFYNNNFRYVKSAGSHYQSRYFPIRTPFVFSDLYVFADVASSSDFLEDPNTSFLFL